MADWIYVDNSNLFIEGQRVSAVQRGKARNIQHAMNHQILDTDYRISFGKLYQFIAGTNRQETKRALLVGSRPPPNDSLWAIAKQAGFEVDIHDRNVANKEKKTDATIITEMTRDAYRNASSGDVFTIVAGDKDYVPPVERLIKDNFQFQVDVVFWDHAAQELRDTCSKFISLNPQLDWLKP